MSNFKKAKLSRRTFLKCNLGGLSVLMGLPFLEIMAPSLSAFADGPLDAPLFGTIYEPNGVKQNGNGWFPSGSGTNFNFSNSAFDQLAAATRAHMTILKGINNTGGSGNAHMQGISQFLTGFPIPNDRVTKHAVGQGSLSVLLAERIALKHGNYKIPFLCLAGNNELDAPNNNVYNNKLKNALDFDKNGNLYNDDRLADLRAIFDSYFKGSSTSATSNEVSKRDTLKLSVIDSVLADAKRLEATLGYSDKQRMDEYLSKVRDIENSINAQYENTGPGNNSCNIQTTNSYTAFSNTARLNRLDLHSDQTVKLVTLALECGITPGFSYMLGGEAAGCHYQDIGINQHCHNSISHNASTGNTNYYKINAYNLRIFEKFLISFQNTMSGGKSLLDRGLFLYGAGLAVGYSHTLNNIPVVWGGHANGRVKGGQLLSVGTKNKTSHMLTTFARALLNESVTVGNGGGINYLGDV
jgi:hypothetical protein